VEGGVAPERKAPCVDVAGHGCWTWEWDARGVHGSAIRRMVANMEKRETPHLHINHIHMHT